MNRETPVFRSLEFIEARISEKLTVENIAGSVYFSRYHYQRLFRKIVGGSVMEYVTKRKLTLAGGELLRTGATVLEIALKYGYDSHEGFTRSFKAYMGVTPTEYRRYGLAAITQKTVKERSNMTYSKSTDEILRELNEFIAKAKETAMSARKCDIPGIPGYKAFWSLIAEKTDALADEVRRELERITDIAEHPDRITSMFDIVKVLDDIAYRTNLINFNAKLMVARTRPEHAGQMDPLLKKYGELACASVMKARKITEFFNELSSLIIADMRKTAAAKIEAAVQKGKAAVDGITGYDYIRTEILNITDLLVSTPVREITAPLLEDLLFRLNIIAFTADIDILRNPQDKALFGGLAAFRESLNEAYEFFQTLVTPENTPAMETDAKKLLSDIAFQGNMYLFYIRGEAEKLSISKLLTDDQKAAFDAVCGKVGDFIQFAHSAADESAYKPAADRLYAVHAAMAAQADTLAEKGGPVRFIAGELKALGEVLTKRAR